MAQLLLLAMTLHLSNSNFCEIYALTLMAVLGFVVEHSGSMDKLGCKTPSAMCHLLGESGPGRELETAEGTYGPTVDPAWEAL